jgi:hypothetical protein
VVPLALGRVHVRAALDQERERVGTGTRRHHQRGLAVGISFASAPASSRADELGLPVSRESDNGVAPSRFACVRGGTGLD